MRGCSPVWVRHVDPLDAGRGAADERRDDLVVGARRGSARCGCGRGSEWRSSSAAGANAAAIEAIVAGSRPARRSSGPRAPPATAQPPTRSSPARTSGSPSTLTSGSITTQSRWTGTWTVPPIAAEAPNATWQVPRIFSSSSRSPVRLARSLVPIPSSATLVPPSPWARQQLQQPLAVGAGRADQVAGLDRQLDRLGDAADRRDRPVDHELALTGALDRRDETLAAGQVAESAGSAEVARVGNPLALAQAEAQIGPVRVGDPGLSARGQQLGDRCAAAAQPLDVGRHHPGDELLGRGRHRRDPHPALGRVAARRGVRERLVGRADDHVGGAHRRGDAARRLGCRARRARRSAPGPRRRPARPASPRRRSPSPIVAGLATTSDLLALAGPQGSRGRSR